MMPFKLKQIEVRDISNIDEGFSNSLEQANNGNPIKV